MIRKKFPIKRKLFERNESTLMARKIVFDLSLTGIKPAKLYKE